MEALNFGLAEPYHEGAILHLNGKQYILTADQASTIGHQLNRTTKRRLKRLKGDDWVQLDELLFKMGWGGYYDFVHQLLYIAARLGAGECVREGTVDLHAADMRDLNKVMRLLEAWAHIVSSWSFDLVMRKDSPVDFGEMVRDWALTNKHGTRLGDF